jgi:diaminopimelate epimerase
VVPFGVIPFIKAHACGNDFLVIGEEFARGNHAALARRLCQRNTSVGADGIEFIERRAEGAWFLRLFNADGSEAELSGNGTRCVAAWLAFSGQGRDVLLMTHGGPRFCRVVKADGTKFEVESAMGVPYITPHAVIVPGVGAVEGAKVNVGNPHFVVFVESDDFSTHGMSWQAMGEKICFHPDFPAQTNVEFVRVMAPDEIEFRIYERGVGPTTSSGTGTCASSSAAIALRGCDRELTAIAEGGAQSLKWPADEDEMMLTGPAEVICWDGKAGEE